MCADIGLKALNRKNIELKSSFQSPLWPNSDLWDIAQNNFDLYTLHSQKVSCIQPLLFEDS